MISGFFIMILLVTIIPVSAEKTITITKTLDVSKDSLENVLNDLNDYNNIFPEYVKSADIIKKEDNFSIAKIKFGAHGFYFDAGIEHIALNDDFHRLKITTSDLKGTTITTSLQETWGYDGTPNMGTDVKVKISLQVSGLLGFLGLVSDEMVGFSVDKSLITLAEHARK